MCFVKFPPRKLVVTPELLKYCFSLCSGVVGGGWGGCKFCKYTQREKHINPATHPFL